MKYLSAVLLALLLGACGGGGGGGSGGSSGGGPGASSPALTLSPSPLVQTITAGTSKMMTVNASVTRPSDFAGIATLYTLIVDEAKVLSPNPGLAQDGNQFVATLFSSPSLEPGSYKGIFQIHLCRDARCTSEVPGSPVSLPYDFTVAGVPITVLASAPLTASVRLGAASTFQTTVEVGAAGRNWTATSNAAWLKLSSASGAGNGSFGASIDVSGLAVGSYSALVDVKASDGQSASVPATLTILPTAFQIQGSNLTFNAVNGATIPAQALQFTLDNNTPTQWNASSSAAWLKLNPLSGTTPANATLSIDRSALPPGSASYNASLTLSSALSAPSTVGVTLNLAAATLSLSPATLSLGGTNGRDFNPRSVTVSLNTDTNSYPWSATAAAALMLPTASGTAAQTGGTLVVGMNSVQAPAGTSVTPVTVTALVNGDTITKQVPVTINKDQHKLLAAETGVAFASTPGWSRLARTIKISDNFGVDAAWSASSSQPWLSVAASGRTTGGAGTLTLSADPSSLPVDQISYATITLSSGDAGVTVPETIKVALWKGSATPASQVKLAQRYVNLVADPIRPLVYVHDGLSALDVYNVYTGAKVASVTGPAGMGSMAVSPNGDTLYAAATGGLSIDLVNLSTLTKTGSWPLVAIKATDSTRLVAARPNGVNVVLTTNVGNFLAASGASLGSSFATGEIAASGDSRRLFTDAGLAYSIDYTAINGGTLLASRYASGQGGQGASGQVAANLDGSRFYIASGFPYRCSISNGDTATQIGQLPGGDAYPNAVKVASDGRVFCGISGASTPAADVWVHRPDGTLQTSFKFAGYAKTMLARQMVVSGDAMMMAALTDDPLLVFVPVGP
ncbi:MAG: BACON domain-containing carbohydrate-binding protein [Massilia sp.]